MQILFNSLLAAVGATGIAWHISSSSEFWPSLTYFMTLFVVGSVSATTRYIRARLFQQLAVWFNGVSISVLVSLLVSAFVLSFGSGVAASALVLLPLLLNVASFKRIRAAIED